MPAAMERSCRSCHATRENTCCRSSLTTLSASTVSACEELTWHHSEPQSVLDQIWRVRRGLAVLQQPEGVGEAHQVAHFASNLNRLTRTQWGGRRSVRVASGDIPRRGKELGQHERRGERTDLTENRPLLVCLPLTIARGPPRRRPVGCCPAASGASWTGGSGT